MPGGFSTGSHHSPSVTSTESMADLSTFQFRMINVYFLQTRLCKQPEETSQPTQDEPISDEKAPPEIYDRAPPNRSENDALQGILRPEVPQDASEQFVCPFTSQQQQWQSYAAGHITTLFDYMQRPVQYISSFLRRAPVKTSQNTRTAPCGSTLFGRERFLLH